MEETDLECTARHTEKANPSQQESLDSEVIPDPMEGEQTWPTEEELAEGNVGLDTSFFVCFYTPPLKCGEVLCYTLRCLSVCPSVRPSVRAHHFRSIT